MCKLLSQPRNIIVFEGYFPFLRDWNNIVQVKSDEVSSRHFEGYFPFLRDWNTSVLVGLLYPILLRRVFPFSQGLKLFYSSIPNFSKSTPSKGISLFSGIETCRDLLFSFCRFFFEGYFPFLRDWNLDSRFFTTVVTFYFEGYFPFLRDWNQSQALLG